MTHYLDYFFFMVLEGLDRCSLMLATFALMERFGVPRSPEKIEGPFLGIEIDTACILFRLPQVKLEKLSLCLWTFLSARKVMLKQMQSLLGLLVFTCRVMPMGRRLLLAIKGVRLSGHQIRLTSFLKVGLRVWLEFLNKYNGHTCFRQLRCDNKESSLCTNALGFWGSF